MYKILTNSGRVGEPWHQESTEEGFGDANRSAIEIAKSVTEETWTRVANGRSILATYRGDGEGRVTVVDELTDAIGGGV